MSLLTIIIVSFLIIFIVMGAAVVTTSKAYTYKHTIDTLPTDDEKKNNDQ